MIDLILILIRYIPLAEKLISMIWKDYEAWRKEYDDNKIKAKVSEALKSDSTAVINEEINKK